MLIMLVMLVWNAAIHSVMVRVVCILYNSKYSAASCVSRVNIVRGIDSNLPLHFPVADRIKTDDRRVNPEFPCGGCAGR
jgi:hypothetical protein